MAKTKVRRISANETHSKSETPATTSSNTIAHVTGPAWAVWILSRFPGVRYHYQGWGTTRRVITAILLYLVALPIIPIIIAAVWYAKDPEGFKKSPLMPVLVAVIAAWLGGFGWMDNQTPITDGTPMASVKAQADGEAGNDKADPAATASQASKDKIANQTTSKASNGKKYENCTAAFEDGVFNIARNNPSYERKLDRDNDGIACEK